VEGALREQRLPRADSCIPGFEVEVEALNADPTPIANLTVPAIVEHLESVVAPIEPAPILMGHSAGGVFTQLLMDRGYGAAGVAINSAPTEGVKRVPLSQIRSSFPVLKNPPTGTRPSGSPSSSGATCSRTRSARRRRGGYTSATTSPRRAASSGTVRSRTSIRGLRTRM
jgi:hypothetical protein